MSLRLNVNSIPTPPSRPDPRHALIVAMLRETAGDWTPARLSLLIANREVPDEYAQRTAEFIADKPVLWVVSDDDFIAGVRVVNPGCATVLGTPAGLDFLHRMSRAVAIRGATIRIKGIFGG